MKSEPDTKLGFVGIGTMGAPMVRCLAQAGHRPILYDVNRDAVGRVAGECGLDAAGNLPDLGRACDTLILMLPRSDIVHAVCMGDGGGANGLVDGLKPGALVIDMSSSDPMETRKLAAALVERDITLLDAPVSGGVRKAISGTLSIMLGSDDAVAASRITPLLSAMGTVIPTGPLASGHASKALNNFVSAAGLVAACEALIVGRKFGLNPGTLVDVLNGSTGRNNSTENKLKQFVLSGEFHKAGFSLDLMAKDVALAKSLSDALGLDLPCVDEISDLWTNARQSMAKDADHTEIFTYLETRAGRDDA
jgi:3-hydroxyisobutyrate dehydrogenase